MDSSIERPPLVSVVVLTYNGGRLLRSVVEKLNAQRIEGGLEVLLVDSGSNDGSERLAQELGARQVRLDRDSFGFGKARQLGFSQARGEIIATISQDYLPCDENWLAKLIAPLQAGADVSLGRGIPHPDRRPFYWETRRFNSTREGREFQARHGGLGFSCMCLATRREVFEAAGFGNDTAFSEDKVFQQNAWQAGFRKFVYTQEAAGFHGHQYTLGSLWKRCRNEGFGWREVGVGYRAGQLALDLLSPSIYAKLGLGLMSGRVRSLSELLFPWVRPLAVFQGNRWSREWQR